MGHSNVVVAHFDLKMWLKSEGFYEMVKLWWDSYQFTEFAKGRLTKSEQIGVQKCGGKREDSLGWPTRA